MPTYRVIDQEGNMVDKNRPPPDISGEEVVKLYKDMLTGIKFDHTGRVLALRADISLVSIMDIIMFDAQRQGRLSFYMVRSAFILTTSVGRRSNTSIGLSRRGRHCRRFRLLLDF